MNRSLWTQTLSRVSCPAWPCPVCSEGAAVLVPKSLVYHETVESKRSRHNKDWSPDWKGLTFTAWAECSHPSCKQQFSIAGKGGVEPDYDSDGLYWEEFFSPLVCHPMPNMIQFPAKCPVDVRDELRAAFSIFWLHRAACAGRIRVALECLINHLGVPRQKKEKNGKYSDLALHARVDYFANNEPVIGPQLMALKWLGNTGSHEREVHANDLLDALEIFEHVLSEIFDPQSAKVAQLAQKLTKKHGH